MHCKWRRIAFAPFRGKLPKAPRTGHTAAHPLPSPLPSSCFTATKILQKNRLYKKYRRLRSLTGHHSTVNQFQPYPLLRSVARNPCRNFGSSNTPRLNQYTIIQENCQCPFGHSYNFAAFCTNSKNSALNWSLATQLSVCKREMTLPKLACPLYSD